MRINYSFVEFHNPVFCSGKNHGAKIKAAPDLKLFFDPSIPNAKMCMEYKGKLTCFDTYHSADVIQEKFETVQAPGPGSVQASVKPHHASKEGKALRSQHSSSQGE